MTTILKRSLGTVLLAMLAACASQPVHYYTLTPPDLGPGPATPAPFLLDVLPVTVPVEVDRQELVIRQGAGSLALLDGERWAAPLNDEVHAALTASLSHQLGTQNAGSLLRPAGMPLLRVKVAIRRFESTPGQQAVLEADWSLSWADPEDKRRLLCGSRLKARAPVDYAGQVEGYQGLVQRMSAQIAATAQGWVKGQAERCAVETPPA